MNKLGDSTQINWITSTITFIGVLIILLNVVPRIGSALIAIAILVTIISRRPCYADSRFYFFSLFFLHTLFQKDTGTKILRLQVIILYFGSGVNKLFDPDWQSGQYLENWIAHKIEFSIYIELASMLPSMALAKLLSWMVILMEILIALCLTTKSYFKLAIWIGILLHSISIVVVNHSFGSFVAGVLISYLAFLNWPSKIIISLPRSKTAELVVKYNPWIDPYHIIKMVINPAISNVELLLNDKKYSGFQALQYFLLYCPISYLLILGIVLFPEFGFGWLKGIVLIVVAFLMLPLVARKIDHLILSSENSKHCN